jgi:hypothetical protein
MRDSSEIPKKKDMAERLDQIRNTTTTKASLKMI